MDTRCKAHAGHQGSPQLVSTELAGCVALPAWFCHSNVGDCLCRVLVSEREALAVAATQVMSEENRLGALN